MWTAIATILVKQDWQATPIVAPEFGYFRLTFATAGIPVWIAQIEPQSGDIWDERHIIATPYAQIFTFEANPAMSDRAIALRVPNFAQSFAVTVELSNIAVDHSVPASGAQTENLDGGFF